MAYVQMPGGLWVPNPTSFPAAAPAFSGTGNGTIDASTEKASFLISIPRSGDLAAFEFLTGAVTFSILSVLRCSFQDINSSGDPDGTQDQYRDLTTVGASSWIVPGLMTSDGTDTGTKRSVTRGQRIACVIEYQTFTALDSIVVPALTSSATSAVDSTFGGFPYPDNFIGGVWIKRASRPILALRYSDGSYYPLGSDIYPIKTLTSVTYASNDGTADERGMKFQVPFAAKLDGAWFRADLDGDADFVVYNGAGSVLGSQSLPAASRQNTGGVNFAVELDTEIELAANTDYYAVVKPTTTTSLTLYEYTIDSAGLMAAIPGGSSWQHVARVDAGAWTTTSTRRPWIALRLSAIDIPSGGGSDPASSLRRFNAAFN